MERGSIHPLLADATTPIDFILYKKLSLCHMDPTKAMVRTAGRPAHEAQIRVRLPIYIFAKVHGSLRRRPCIAANAQPQHF